MTANQKENYDAINKVIDWIINQPCSKLPDKDNLLREFQFARERMLLSFESEKIIQCSSCRREHKQITSNCCWIKCSCGSRICGGCGSTSIVRIDSDPNNNEAQYGCSNHCERCGLMGCGMCIDSFIVQKNRSTYDERVM